HFGAVTIATNMAGRGTDILLGGNPDFMARRTMRQEEYPDDIIETATGKSEHVSDDVLAARTRFNALKDEYRKTTDVEHEKVVALGGLHIIGTERHESRRIDNQLRGRAGRQGDPGSSQFFISLEDDLMRLFGGERIQSLVEKLGMDDSEPLEAGMLTKQIENAQKRIESRNYEIRKNVLKYDDVMNQQRELIYTQRRQVLEGENMHESIVVMAVKMITEAVDRYCTGENADWDIEGIKEYLEKLCIPVGTFDLNQEAVRSFNRQGLIDFLQKSAKDFFAEREDKITQLGIDMRELERSILLRSVDRRWMDHIDAMDQLRDGIGLRAYAQRDPVNEYKMESYDMFDEMVRLIQEDTIRHLYQLRIEKAPERKAVANVTSAGTPVQAAATASKTPVSRGEKVGRNSPCPCGSGKKYKNCHGRNVSA
ncbi:MAG: preprotein translocase subunit SecA, partial [Clostridiales bacterium]|nr:preprotein translocase subunit SecA [Clostridiales bacterium]